MIKRLLSRRKDREREKEEGAVVGAGGRRFKRYKKQVCYDFGLL